MTSVDRPKIIPTQHWPHDEVEGGTPTNNLFTLTLPYNRTHITSIR